MPMPGPCIINTENKMKSFLQSCGMFFDHKKFNNQSNFFNFDKNLIARSTVKHRNIKYVSYASADSRNKKKKKAQFMLMFMDHIAY